jgi:hypothetical protein
MLINNKVYKILEYVARIALPALGTLYFALAGLWNLPHAEQVVGTITAVDVFLGVLLGLAMRSYDKSDAKYAGTIEVENQPGTDQKLVSLVINGKPEDIFEMKSANFKVTAPTP